MGAGASVPAEGNENEGPSTNPEALGAIQCNLRSIREAMEEALFIHEKWPLIIDPSGQAARFLSYQPGPYLLAISPEDMKKENLRQALVGALGRGTLLTIVFDDLADANLDELFQEGAFPRAVLDRAAVSGEGFWRPLLTEEEARDFEPKSEFCLCVCAKAGASAEMGRAMALIECGAGGGRGGGGGEEDQDEAFAEAVGAKEDNKNSVEMVEAAFDGELDVVKAKIDEGCELESVDGSKHTGLSEAASQGHDEVVKFLLELGANPNNVNAHGRTPLWRAAYNGHTTTVALLLAAGCDPRLKDRTSMEGPFDVAKTDEVRAILSEWKEEKTDELIAEWRENRRKKIEANIKTAAEREAYEKARLREEMAALVAAGRAEALRDRLTELAQEAERTGKAIGTADTIRDPRGMTLLALAVEKDNEDMVRMLLTHWKITKQEFDEIGLSSADSYEIKMFKTNPNARDAKGWNIAAVAVFAVAKKALKLLLENGADPYMKSSYNKSAWDLAQDELDAALNVMKSNAEIRGVIEDWARDQEGGGGGKLLKDGPSVKPGGRSAEAANPVAEGPREGTAAMLAVEVAAEGSGGGGGGGKKGGGGGGKKGGAAGKGKRKKKKAS